MIKFQCLWCSQEFSAPDNLAGKKIKCKNCGSPVDVPRPGTAPPAPRQAPAAPAYQAVAAPAQAGSGDPFSNLEAPETAEPVRRRRGSTFPGMLIGLLGALVLGVGAFLPALSVPNVGKVSYWQLGTGKVTTEDLKEANIDPADYKITNGWLSIDGAIIVVLALFAFLFALARSPGMLYLTGLAALGTLGYTFGRFYLVKLFKNADTPAEGDFCIGLANALLPQARLQTGWAVLLAGAGLLFFAGIVISFMTRRR